MREPATYIRNTENLYKKLGYKPYDWFQADSPPAFTLPAKLLKESRLGLISTSGAYVAGQVAYHYKDDTSIRSIPADTDQAKLRFSHIMENYLIEARQDPQCVLPLRALQKLKEEESVKGLAQNYYSCMGGIYSQRRVREELIPSLQQALSSEEIDLLILIPLWPVCHQTVCLIARHFETLGIPTLVLGSALDIMKAGRPPRAAFLNYPLGFEAGRFKDTVNQYEVIKQAVSLFDQMQKESIVNLDYQWEEGWEMVELRETSSSNPDQRSPRDETPQYQSEEDKRLAEAIKQKQ